ncbi:MAG: nitrogenase [Elusimicrobia bacterium]|nr:nitrogenase [Elusimicrobiota bacterium]
MEKTIIDRPATRNSCVLCAPLGASIVFQGIEGCLPLLHGSQGCATYIRRYLISHFREPVDIASSNFSEESAIFGGKENLKKALSNLITQYQPRLIGVASTCLSETIGDDVRAILKEYRKENQGSPLPEMVNVSTPSYHGSHWDGFWKTVLAVVTQLSSQEEPVRQRLNVFPGLVSTADLRHLREIFTDFGISFSILPDYADSLDSDAWDNYHSLHEGGTPLSEIRAMGRAEFSLDLGQALTAEDSASGYLAKNSGVTRLSCGWPVGINESDAFFRLLSRISSQPVPEKYRQERSRLLDAYYDGHKYMFGKRAVVYGSPEMVAAIVSMLKEIGVIPVFCSTADTDFAGIEERVIELRPDFLIGSSKGYQISRKTGIPLLRAGFPIHDRFGGQRELLLGYRGTQRFFDHLVNVVIAGVQDSSPGGYAYV